MRVLNRQFDGAWVGLEPKKSDLEMGARNDPSLVVKQPVLPSVDGHGRVCKEPYPGPNIYLSFLTPFLHRYSLILWLLWELT